MSSFARMRIAFVVFGGRILLQSDYNDERTCKQWMAEDLRMLGDAYTNATRGYIFPGRIQFFTGGDADIPDVNVTADLIEDAMQQYQNIYGNGDRPVICNGVIPGGEDAVWRPILIWDGRWIFA